ncbi:MAG: lytic transglycosylase domain-containing protein [Betaproteobacteria bacterium]|nr:lytic transglycosylase domain-containing protein [Betaproteobacteria bacterium]
MFAKSTLDWDRLVLSRLARRTRSMVSAMVLVASLSALLLIVHNQHGPLGSAGAWQSVFPEGLTPAATLQSQSGSPVGVTPIEEARYRALAEFLAKRYRVSQEVTFDLVGLAHGAAHKLGLDPLLVIAVIAVESRFNPIAESVAGAKGLMQIIPKYHSEKLEEHGGDRAVFDPATNILVGTQILREYIRLTGNLGIALQMYAGALNDNEDQYTTKVLNEKKRLKQVVSKTPSLGASNKPAAGRPL